MQEAKPIYVLPSVQMGQQATPPISERAAGGGAGEPTPPPPRFLLVMCRVW